MAEGEAVQIQPPARRSIDPFEPDPPPPLGQGWPGGRMFVAWGNAHSRARYSMHRRMSPPQPRTNDADLAQALAALGSPVRLAILRELREPKILKEIEVQPARDDEGRPDRALSRQAVKRHLEQMLELGLVASRQTTREFGATVEYLANHQMVYALAEECRGLAELRPVEEPDVATLDESQTIDGYDVHGPCLVVAKGLEEGKAFELDPAATGTSTWRIGRNRGLEVPLDYDPYVSSAHAVIRLEEGGFLVEDLEESRNGTWLNFRALAPGEPEPLASGDVIGLGRSLLVFRG